MGSDSDCAMGDLPALSTAANAGFKCAEVAFFRVFERTERTKMVITFFVVVETTSSRHMYN